MAICLHEDCAQAIVDLDELDCLMRFGVHGSSAFVLLYKLRGEHGDRCRRGGTFALMVKSMVRAESLPGWTRERYKKSITVLLDAGFITKAEMRCGQQRYILIEPHQQGSRG